MYMVPFVSNHIYMISYDMYSTHIFTKKISWNFITVQIAQTQVFMKIMSQIYIQQKIWKKNIGPTISYIYVTTWAILPIALRGQHDPL